ncbi:MAG TPA: hypothetical protein VM370_11935 [Candidatus Thermoplasmatota archaeon]|nr:hypothetical protein [Candidatus Thermoplasmatota archaeon]
MRVLMLAFIGLFVLAFAAAPTASAGFDSCDSLPKHNVCTYPDEPSSIICVSDNGRQVACVVDPCGTTACF